MTITLKFTFAPYSVQFYALHAPFLPHPPTHTWVSLPREVAIQKWHQILLQCEKSRHNHGYRGQL